MSNNFLSKISIIKMLRIIFIIIALSFFSCSFLTKNKGLTKIKFDNYSYVSLKVEVIDTLECTFRFWNIGSEDLIVNNVKPSCDCTVIGWTNNNIKNNESGEIRIKYTSPHPRFFLEYIFVYYNGKDSPIMLSISGDVTDGKSQ